MTDDVRAHPASGGASEDGSRGAFPPSQPPVNPGLHMLTNSPVLMV